MITPPHTTQNHGFSDTTTSWTLMLSYSVYDPLFVMADNACSIQISWATLWWLSVAQFHQFSIKERKNGHDDECFCDFDE